jgi:acyl-coenzyme A synthetase/AMP-(fatty) acid ligase
MNAKGKSDLLQCLSQFSSTHQGTSLERQTLFLSPSPPQAHIFLSIFRLGCVNSTLFPIFQTLRELVETFKTAVLFQQNGGTQR